MSSAPEAAKTEITTDDLFSMVVDDALGLTPEQPEAVAEAPQETAPEVEDTFEIDPEIPDDLAAFLAEDEPPVMQEPAFELPEEDEEEFEFDEEKASLKKQLKQLEKKAAWAEEQRVKATRPKWEAEAEKFFPFSDPASISADSRRGFLRAAKEQHERNKQIFGTRGQKAAEAVVAAARAEAEQIRAQAKAEAEKAWGTPGVNLSPQAPGTAAASPEKYDEAYRRGGLAAAIRSQFQPGGE